MKRQIRQFKTARPDRPLGPADCLKTRLAGECSKCGADTARLHVPTRLVLGKFCEGCCPACNAIVRLANEIPAQQPKSKPGTR